MKRAGRTCCEDSIWTLFCVFVALIGFWFSFNFFFPEPEALYLRKKHHPQQEQVACLPKIRRNRFPLLLTDALFFGAPDRPRAWHGRTSQVVAWKAVGNASEIAMIKFVQEFRDIDEYRAANPNVFKIPFNSKNKYQVCTVTHYIHTTVRHDGRRTPSQDASVLLPREPPPHRFSFQGPRRARTRACVSSHLALALCRSCRTQTTD